jgi:hypothetical protein
MIVYKHAARCPSSIQIFLNFNSTYSRFIPIPIREAERQNQNYIIPSSLVLFDMVNIYAIGSADLEHRPANVNTRSDEAVRSCLRNIPPVPTGYAFSLQQRIQQFQYFKNKQDIKMKPNESLDIFNVAIIALCKY